MTEGSLLNIGKICAGALSIPYGEYMIYATEAGHTMLVPVRSRPHEVFEDKGPQYEVLTHKIISNWYDVNKVLSEDENEEEMPETAAAKSDSKESEFEKHQFTSKVDPADIDRNPMLRAMEQQGETVTSLADKIGVDKSMVSRLLRTPQDRQGDPGGRNPSIGTASKIAGALRLDVEALFPDIFGMQTAEAKPKEVKATRGSGMTGAAAGSMRKGKASKKWTQGAS
jgi:antitoxin component HigA of HigAB toxin-antitoxin module